MTEPFRVPEPSQEAVDAYRLDQAQLRSLQSSLRAAYAVDLPALCRAEAVRIAEFLAEKAANGDPKIGPNGWTRVYLADRYGFPEEV